MMDYQLRPGEATYNYPIEVTHPDYPIHYLVSGSSTKVADTNEMLDNPFPSLARKRLKNPRLYRKKLWDQFKINLSSLQPHFDIGIDTSLIEESVEKDIPEEVVEYDIAVHIPPKKRYTINLEVREIRKAEPKIVESTEFDYE